MKLSIIIPVCNVEQYIGPCLESIYRQGLSDKDFEVIVVNDGSTDNSMKVVEEIQERHKNISQINPVQTTPTPPNSGGETAHVGPSVCRNTGMEMAKGEYVLFVDDNMSVLGTFHREMPHYTKQNVMIYTTEQGCSMVFNRSAL